MIEQDINERMAGLAPSQNIGAESAVAAIMRDRGMTPTVEQPFEEPQLPQAGPPVQDPADAVVDRILERRRERLTSTMYGASKVNPDKAALAQKLAQETGIGSGIALRHLDELMVDSRMREIERKNYFESNPVLSEQLSDPEFAAVAQDDIGTLEKIGDFFKEWSMFQRTGYSPSIVKGVARGTLMVERGRIGTAAELGLATPQDIDRAEQMREDMGKLQGGGLFAATAEVVTQQIMSLKQTGTAAAGGAAIGSAIPGVGTAAGGALGFMAGTIMSTAQMEGGNAYLDMRGDGVSDDVAIPAAIAIGYLNGAIEVAGLKLAASPFKSLAKKAFKDATAEALAKPTVRAALAVAGKEYAKQVGGEATEESLQQFVSIIGERIAKAAEGIEYEGTLKSDFGQILDSFAGGALASVLLGSVGPGSNLVYDLNRAEAAANTQRVLENLSSAAKEGTLRPRSPVMFERYLQAQAERYDADTIYISAPVLRDVINQSGMTPEQLEQVLPGTAERIREALFTGGDVKIPTAQFAATVAGSKFGDALIPHMRLDPDAKSAAEASAILKNRESIRQEATQIIQQMEQTNEAFVQSARNVEDTFRRQVEGAGRPREEADVAAVLLRDFYVTMAAKRGITPEEAYAADAVTIAGEAGVAPTLEPLKQADQFDQAGQRRTDTPEFKAWNNRSEAEGGSNKLNDKDGKPIRLFHGTPRGGFVAFDPARIGLNTRYGRGGFSFTTNQQTAEAYAYSIDAENAQMSDMVAAANRIMETVEYSPLLEQEGIWTSGDPTIYPEFDVDMMEDMDDLSRFINNVAAIVRRTGQEAAAMRLEDVVRTTQPPVPEVFEVYVYVPQNARELTATRETIGQVLAGINVRNEPGQAIIVNMPNDEKVVIVADPTNIKSVDNRGTWSRTTANIMEQAAMSTRVPTAVKPIEDALNDVLLADFPSFLRDEKFVSKNLAKFKELNAPIRIDETATEQQQLEQIISHMTSNLLWLHDAMEPAIRERARMWYVGGRRLVDWLAERHGMSPMGAATVFAVLSPQKNWYENVGLGIRIIDIVATQGSATMDAEMQDAYLNSLRKEQTKSEGKLSKHDAAKPERGKKEIEAWETKRAELAKEAKAASDKVAEAQGKIDAIGKRTLEELLRDREFVLAAIMVRWFDQTKNDRTYPVISPEGGVGAPMLTEAGTPASIRYGSYNEVSKAIAAYVDGRAENVHYLIGGEHKVRNFYNNLFNPDDPRFTTIDTHAIAAAYLMPLAGTDKLVQHGLGSGVGNAMFGMGGGYAVFYEAYRRAAEARGIQPREMQSITWEAIRGMFEAAMKGGLKAPVAATWKRYVDGEIDIDAARADVMQRAGGITTPTWVSLPMDMKPAAGYEGVSRTAADAQAGRIAAKPTAASVMFEVAPDPADVALVKQWEALSPQQRQAISVRVAEDIIPRILGEYGVAADMVMQVGGWEGATNVGFALRMPPGPLVRQIAQAVGYALSQQAVFTLSATQFQGSTKSDIIVLQLQPGTTVEQVGDLYEKKLFPLGIQGHATVQDAMIISLDPGVDGAILADILSEAVTGDGRVIEITHATGWRSLDETRPTDEAARAADEGRRTEGTAGQRRVDAYRSEATRLVAEYLKQAGILEQAARGPARGTFDPRTLITTINRGGDLSTLIHESAHAFLTIYARIAERPDAPAQIKADIDALLKWFGIAGATPEARLAAWNGMTLEQQKKYHERFAYNFEIYAWEGKAPSAELRGLFNRFRTYLTRIYKSIRDDLNAIYRREFGEDLPILTNEVRQVMDRMLASEEQIRRYQAVQSMAPIFQTQEEAGMDDATWAAYVAMNQEAEDQAIADLTKASLAQVGWMKRARETAERAEERGMAARRKDVRKEAEDEVRLQLVYRVQQYLRTGKFRDEAGEEVTVEGPHRLSIERIKEVYAGIPTEESIAAIRATGMAVPSVVQPDWRKLGTGKSGMLAKEGLDPEMVAQTFGYDGADAMIRALVDAKPINEAIEQRTDELMQERYGEMDTPEAREQRISMAIHNEARARFIAVELRHIAKATQPVRVMLEAARIAAEDIISGRRIRDIRPQDHEAAEARAARDAANARRAGGNPAAAAQAAYTRAKNAVLEAPREDTPEALLAASEAAEVAGEAARAASMQQSAERINRFVQEYGNVEPDLMVIRAKRAQLYQNQLAAEARKAKEYVEKQVKYLRRVLRDENRKRMGAEYADQIEALLSNVNIVALTVEQRQRLADLAEWLKKMEENGNKPDISEDLAKAAFRVPYKDLTLEQFRELVEAVRTIEYMGKNQQKLLLEKQKADFKEKEAAINKRIEAVARSRGRDAKIRRSAQTRAGKAVEKIKGFFASGFKAWAIVEILDGGPDGPLYNFLIRTATERANMETDMTAKATERLAAILKPWYDAGSMMAGKVMFPSIGRAMTREARLAIALNVGNAGNIQRLLDGEGWTMDQIQPILESLTSKEWDAVQQIWDFMDEYRPLIAEKERRLFGKEPNWVEPQELTVRTADGQVKTLRGGYYPIVYDPVATFRSEKQSEVDEAQAQLKGAYSSATTRRTFTKERAAKVEDMPLLYSLQGLWSGVTDVIHDLSWHEWLIDANRLMRSEEFDRLVRSRYGDNPKLELRRWIEDNASGNRGVLTPGARASSFFRQNVSVAGLGYSIRGALMQLTGFSLAVTRVGYGPLVRAIGAMAINPLQTMRRVNSMSKFMEMRSRTQFRELNEIRNRVEGERGWQRGIRSHAYTMMLSMQRLVDIPTWIAGYENAIAAGKDEDAAIALGDQAVIATQGSGLLKDLSRIEREPGLAKLFSVFYSYFNTVFNLAAVQTMNARSKGKAAHDLLMILVVPVMLEQLLKEILTPDGDDAEEKDLQKIAAKLTRAEVEYLLGMFMYAREMSGLAGLIEGEMRGYEGPAGLRVITTVQRAAQQAAQGEFDRGFRKASVDLLGAGLGLPSAQINRTIDGLEALSEGETENPLSAVMGIQRR